MVTVNMLVRWLLEKVIETPDVVNYEITLLVSADNTREETEEWFIDHEMKQVVIAAASDEPDEGGIYEGDD